MSAYSMPLNEILALLRIDSQNDLPIESLTLDSRAVARGALFFAYPGAALDGRDYIKHAQTAGAAAVVYESTDFELPSEVSVPAFAVSNLQPMVGHVAHAFYRRPSTELQVFGVTGTNGKTTCCFLLTQAFTALHLEAVMMGTLGVGKLDQLGGASHTTPDPISVHRLLAQFRDQGITQVCMEVSSHALDQGRVNGVEFFCVLFTNLSHDHLDYHGDMRSYAAAKQRLFTDFNAELAVINAADEMGAQLAEVANSEFIVSYGTDGDVEAHEVELCSDGIHMHLDGNGVEFEASSPLIGAVNVPNLELLIATLLALSTSVEEVKTIVQSLRAAPGRMELFKAADKASVVVDYAHTPDALEKALLSIREHCQGALWCVFGCGGDRDREKRPLMGAAADQHAEHLIITNDNPRSESDSAIAADIAKGIRRDHRVILDRAAAIEYAINHAAREDWVLIAGKGHETTQQIGTECRPFSDRGYVAATIGVPGPSEEVRA